MTANLVFTVAFYIYYVVINPADTGGLRFKLPGGAQSGAPLRRSFH